MSSQRWPGWDQARIRRTNVFLPNLRKTYQISAGICNSRKGHKNYEKKNKENISMKSHSLLIPTIINPFILIYHLREITIKNKMVVYYIHFSASATQYMTLCMWYSRAKWIYALAYDMSNAANFNICCFSSYSILLYSGAFWIQS